MRINKMTASFGKLKNSTMELSSGLNVINAPNEYGKSTWCGFINAMLYGIDTSERDRAGYLSPKTRFRPWDGGNMAGTMEVTHAGRGITIQRTTKGVSPMKNFIAVYTGTADFIHTITGDNAGEYLTGVTRHVFERTAFIRRPDIRVNQESDLEKRISAMVSSGEENTSYSDSDELLRRWQRKLRYNKSGSIPALEQELHDAQKKLELIESSSEEVVNLRGSMSRLEKQIELMKHDLVIHSKLEQRAAARKLDEAKAAAEAAEERVSQLNAALTKNGHKMTREDINEIRETASAVMPLKEVSVQAEKNLWQAEKALSDISAKRRSSPLFGRSEESVNEDISKGRELEEQTKNVKTRRVPRPISCLLIALAVIGLICFSGALMPLAKALPAIRPYVGLFGPGIAGSLALACVGVLLFFLKLPKRRSAADELSELLEKYGVSSVDKLSSLLSSYSAISREEEEKRAARDGARAAYDSASAAAQDASTLALQKLSVFMPEISSGEEVLTALNETEKLLDKLTHAEFERVATRNVYETVLAEYDDSVEVDDSYLPTPLRNKEDTLSALERAKQQLSDVTRSYDLATGAQRTLGDPAVIEGRIQALNEQLENERLRHNALTVAIETLAEANAELQTRFSPVIGRKAGEIFSRLTGGRYERLVFDKGFDAEAKESERPESRNVLSLSDGTADEIYLSLRLAMCELLLGGSDPCPIILDDALANFDDARCHRALDLLLELSKERQIIMFSCHTREADYLSETPDVNIIRYEVI